MTTLESLITKFREVMVSGALSDSLDEIGVTDCVSTNWMTSKAATQFYGRARTIKLEERENEFERFDLSLKLMAGMSSREVLIIQGSNKFAYFGEMMATFAQEKGIPGVVVDGLTRDNLKTSALMVDIVARGLSPIDVKGRGAVTGVDVPIEIGGNVRCRPGDFIYVDADSVIVIPIEVEANLLTALEKTLKNEQEISRSLSSGESVETILSKFHSF